MKAFHTIAVPHKDIVSGRLTMDIFAADLEQVAHGKGPEEYRDAGMFFEKTYETEGLKNLLNIIQRRVEGKGGDPVIQLQTPFGGGKTHSLIAIYHKAKEWGANRVVIVGTNLDARETLWGIVEKQLTGKCEKLTGNTSPGKNKLMDLLEQYQPMVILIDELLEYATKAGGVKVGEGTMASQALAFMQELTESVASLEKVSLVITLPSSETEHYDESAEKMFQQLKKVTGRNEKIYTPVNENEIANIVRQRLFRQIDEGEVKKVVSSFMKYAEKEGILPLGIEPTEYRDKFINSYPFMPEVIEVLYHRWGSYPSFQRTRGVLRLLALVVSSLIKLNTFIPYISLADFDLTKGELREELLKHIGPEYNSVIAQDITDYNSGSGKINKDLGSSYERLRLGTRTTTTIFMYSFSGGTEKGATLQEIKRCATTLNNPSSVIGEAVEKCREKLFYLQTQGGKYFFSNQPNLNRLVLTKMENIPDKEVQDIELKLLRKSFSGEKVKVYICPNRSADIPDNEEFKLVVLLREDKDVIMDFMMNKGASPRINCNTLFFLFPMESNREKFGNIIRKYRAYELLSSDKTLSLTKEQEKEIGEELKKAGKEMEEEVRYLYRMVGVPSKRDYEIMDLGIPTHGVNKPIDVEIYEKLCSEGKILEKMTPLFIKEKYLAGKEYVGIKQIWESCYRTRGETMPASKSVLEECICEGVSMGIFGFGELVNDVPVCRYYRETPSVFFGENEIIIAESLCKKEGKEGEQKTEAGLVKNGATAVYMAEQNREKGVLQNSEVTTSSEEYLDRLSLKFKLPKAKVSDVLQVMKYIDNNFNDVQIIIEAKSGKISKRDYEMKIEEAFNQLGVKLE